MVFADFTGAATARPIGLALLVSASVLILNGCEQLTPEQRRQKLHLPPPGFAGDERSGSQVFARKCAECHGATGRGTPAGPSLVDKTYRSAHHADLAFHVAVRDGVRQHHSTHGDMPAMGERVDPREVAHAIAYIRAEQRRAGIE